MSAHTKACVLLVLISLAPTCLAQELPEAHPNVVGVDPEKVMELRTFMQSLVDDGKIAGGVTLMARHGKVVHLAAVGMADIEQKRRMQKDSIFRLSSMTKPITSTAVMQLVDDGCLSLDDDVSKYIPAFKRLEVMVSDNPIETVPAESAITIQHLLTHTSGLAGINNKLVGSIYRQRRVGVEGPNGLTLRTNIDRISGIPLAFRPGSDWKYSSCNSDVLARVVEVVSQKSFRQFCKSRIFKPLGMHDTDFFIPTGKLNRLATAYSSKEQRLQPIRTGETISLGHATIVADSCYRGPQTYTSGAAGLCSTASDYAKFCQMLLNKGELFNRHLLKPKTVELMTSDKIAPLRPVMAPLGFGLGFRTIAKEMSRGNDVGLMKGYDWAGYWTTNFLVCSNEDWILISLIQRTPGSDLLEWYNAFQLIAYQAIDGP